MRLLSVLAAAFALVLPPALESQIVPGGRTRSGSRLLAELYANVIPELDALMEEWTAAWTDGDLRRVSEAYTEDAVLRLPGRIPADGPDAIAELLATAVPAIARVDLSLIDFDAADQIAYRLGDFTLGYMAEDGSLKEVAGRHLTVFAQESGDWKLRGQFFFRRSGGGGYPWDDLPATPQRPVSPSVLGDRSRPDYQPGARRYFQEVNRAFALWRTAWRDDDLEALSSSFAPEAVAELPGQSLEFGQRSIGFSLEDILEPAGLLQAAIFDFDFSSQLAYLSGRYFCECGPEGETTIGDYAAILSSRTGDWVIRSIIFGF